MNSGEHRPRCADERTGASGRTVPSGGEADLCPSPPPKFARFGGRGSRTGPPPPAAAPPVRRVPRSPVASSPGDGGARWSSEPAACTQSGSRGLPSSARSGRAGSRRRHAVRASRKARSTSASPAVLGGARRVRNARTGAGRGGRPPDAARSGVAPARSRRGESRNPARPARAFRAPRPGPASRKRPGAGRAGRAQRHGDGRRKRVGRPQIQAPSGDPGPSTPVSRQRGRRRPVGRQGLEGSSPPAPAPRARRATRQAPGAPTAPRVRPAGGPCRGSSGRAGRAPT